MSKPFPVPALFVCALGACTSSGSRSAQRKDLAPALASLSGDDLMRHMRVLADDAFEGRGPGTEGDRKTVEYLVGQFRSLGLAPGNPDGSYVQRVPLMGFEASSKVSIATQGETLALEPLRDVVVVSRSERTELSALDVVFVGYGTVAPEYGWDDFKDVDVSGKAIVMLVNDPPVPDAGDPTKLDGAIFRGKAMTYYGRWTYKYESAKQRNAAAVLLVHEPHGRTLDVVSIGLGFSTLDEVLAAAAALQGRRIEPDAEPEKGFYFRSDHFSFARRGVPALYAESGVDYRDRPAGWGRAQRERYTAEDYHKPSDEIRDDWDLSGALEDVGLYLRVAWMLSQTDEWPEWKPGSEFKAVREAMLRGAR